MDSTKFHIGVFADALWQRLGDLTILGPLLAGTAIVAGFFAFASKLVGLWGKDKSSLNKRERLAARLEVWGSGVVAAIGFAALWAILFS